MTIVDKIKNLATSKKITIAELERTLNLGGGTVSRWNSRIPGIDKIQKVAHYFDVPIDYLVGDIESPYWALNNRDERDIESKLQEIIQDLEHNLLFSKEEQSELSEETRELLRLSMENSIRLAKQMAKKKFTPKKYRN